MFICSYLFVFFWLLLVPCFYCVLFLLCLVHCMFLFIYFFEVLKFSILYFLFLWIVIVFLMMFYFLFVKCKIEWCFLQLIPAAGFTQHLWCDFCFLLLEKVREGDLLEGLGAKMRVFVKILPIFVMEGGVKTQTTSIQLTLPQFSSKCLKLHQSLQWLAPGNGRNTYSIFVFFSVFLSILCFFDVYCVFWSLL